MKNSKTNIGHFCVSLCLCTKTTTAQSTVQVYCRKRSDDVHKRQENIREREGQELEVLNRSRSRWSRRTPDVRVRLEVNVHLLG